MMTKAKRTIIKPIMAKVSVFLAPSTLTGSPPEVKNLIPDQTIKIMVSTPAKGTAKEVILVIKTGIQRKVAMSFTTQFIH